MSNCMNIYKFESKFIIYESGYYIFQLNKALKYLKKYINFDNINTDTLMDSLVDIIISYEHISSFNLDDSNNSKDVSINKYILIQPDPTEEYIIEFKFTNEDCIEKIYSLFMSC